MEKNINPCTERIVQIENNTHCNYSCWFCQNRYYVRPKKRMMDMDLFEHILEEVRTVYTKEELNIVTFSVYNEPTLDPHFLDRLRMMTEMGFIHQFVSNGSHITKEMVNAIIEEELNVDCFRLNVPTINPKECQKIVGINAEYLDKILKRLDYTCDEVSKADIPISIMVNGNGTMDHKNTFYEVVDRFNKYKVDFSMTAISNRAGMLDHIIEGKIDHLYGHLNCRMNYFDNLYIGVDGNLYVCCNDYYQEYSFGNLQRESLKDLLESKERDGMIKKYITDWCKHCSLAVR